MSQKKNRKKVKTLRAARAIRKPVSRGSSRALPVDPAVAQRTERARVLQRDLTWKCDRSQLPFRSTASVTPLRGLLGQDRALETLAMGLKMRGLGYNLFICGLEGAEAMSLLCQHIGNLRLPRREVPDYCYVHDFRDPHRPRLLRLPGGQGPKLQEGVHDCLRRLHAVLSKKPENRWRACVREVLDARLPLLREQFPQRDVQSWLREWRRQLVGHIHQAAIEDFEVNCVKASVRGKPPVVHEQLPTYSNLLGTIGRRLVGEQAQVPHFTEIVGGSLLQADGGVLVVHAADLQYAQGVWATLKSCLKYGTLHLEDGDFPGQPRGTGLKPEPIPLEVKVVLVGDFSIYDQLFETELDFRDVFKLRVDFDSEVAVKARVIRRDYPAFIARACQSGGLRPVSASGVARILEVAVRKAGRKGKVSTQSWFIADLLREADYWAAQVGRRVITHSDVERAVNEGIRRLNLVETKISEMITDGTILIATGGLRVGQVNGLAIYDMGDYLFAKPSRITCETSVGQGGIINIEREVGFSGRSHDKGVQILVGYLRSRFAQNRPLSLTATLCFEQSYSGVDGDSASATEIYALLSSLAGLPVRQDIAVTGSLNQKGDVQPIGGVNEKVEGFFDCVRSGRPTGSEGVIIPQQNVNDLMLRDDVVAAVAKGKFHIYAIDKIEQGIEILTGAPVGRRRKDGSYTPDSIFARVDSRLDEIAQGLRRFSDSEG